MATTPAAAARARRKSTSTSSFGVSRREGHDARVFYSRFTPPAVDFESSVYDGDRAIDQIFLHDARTMPEVPDNSVALVVTSPPYFAGKEYEEALGEGHVPATYLEYLQLLEDVFAECLRKLEPGGRIAVNVANLGRRPYRSLSADVISILQDKLRLLLRGEVIWQKARGSAGNCAWGSFQRPTNPVLRDLTERIVVASKGRFDRALTFRERQRAGLPYRWSLSRDDFMELTTDVWEMPAESATRVGHPAPFPVELPERLIHLYTYYGDLVLDPFMGVGTTAVAAIATDRHFAGYETDSAYHRRAVERIRDERSRNRDHELPAVVLPDSSGTMATEADAPAMYVHEGKAAKDIARAVLEGCAFTDVRADQRCGGGVEVNFTARDRLGRTWLFDVAGGFTRNRPGLKRTDALWKALGKAAVLHAVDPDVRLVLLTAETPERGSSGDAALGAVWGAGKPIRDVVRMLCAEDRDRLRAHAIGST